MIKVAEAKTFESHQLLMTAKTMVYDAKEAETQPTKELLLTIGH